MLPNNATHTDSAKTLGFHFGRKCRRAGDGERSPGEIRVFSTAHHAFMRKMGVGCRIERILKREPERGTVGRAGFEFIPKKEWPFAGFIGKMTEFTA